MLMQKRDNGAQRSFVWTFEFDSFGSKQFGPLSAWNLIGSDG